jgi:hypothetical protein
VGAFPAPPLGHAGKVKNGIHRGDAEVAEN